MFISYQLFDLLINNTISTSKYLFPFRWSCLETLRWTRSVPSYWLVFGLVLSIASLQKETLVRPSSDIKLSFVVSDAITLFTINF